MQKTPRTFFDKAVYDQGRLDFIAGPHCIGFSAPKRDIRYIKRDKEVVGLSPLLAPVDASVSLNSAKDLARPKQNATIKKVAKQKGLSEDDYRNALETNKLPSSYPLYLPDGTLAENLTEDTVIQHPIDGQNTEKTMFFYNDGRPIIHSFAHGRQKWVIDVEDEGEGVATLLPEHPETEEVYQMMLKTFREYRSERILPEQWKAQISLYLHLLDGHKGRYYIELLMGSAKTQVLLHIILFQYKRRRMDSISLSFEKITEIEDNYNWLIERMEQIQQTFTAAECLSFPYKPQDYLTRRHSKERTAFSELQQTPVIIHTHHVIRSHEFTDTFFTYKGKERDLFIYDEGLPSSLEVSLKVEKSIDHINYVISRYETGKLSGLPIKYLEEFRRKLLAAQRKMIRIKSIKGIDIEIPKLDPRFIKTGYYIDNEEIASFIVSLFYIASSSIREIRVSREKGANALLSFKENQVGSITRLVNTDSSRGARKVHKYAYNKILKYPIKEYTGDKGKLTVYIAPLKKTGRESVAKDHSTHLGIINNFINLMRPRKVLVCVSKSFPNIPTGDRQGILYEDIRDQIKHPNVVFTSWGKHKQTNEFRDCDCIIVPHLFRKPYYAYKNSIFGELGYIKDDVTPAAIKEVEIGSIVESLQQLFGRGAMRDGKDCVCLTFTPSLNDSIAIGEGLEDIFSSVSVYDYDARYYDIVKRQKRTDKKWANVRENQAVKNFRKAAKNRGYTNSEELEDDYMRDWRMNDRITPVKWLKSLETPRTEPNVIEHQCRF